MVCASVYVCICILRVVIITEYTRYFFSLSLRDINRSGEQEEKLAVNPVHEAQSPSDPKTFQRKETHKRLFPFRRRTWPGCRIRQPFFINQYVLRQRRKQTLLQMKMARDRGFVFLFFNSNFSFFLIFFFIFLYFLYAHFADTMSFLSMFDKCGFKFEIFFRYVRFSSVEGTLDRSNANVAKKK